MLYIYLDESGDLGFDFLQRKNTSKVFTITIMLVYGVDDNRAVIKAIDKTIKRKLAKKLTHELKGTRTSFEVKQYFYNQIAHLDFEIYSLTIDKRKVYDSLQENTDKLYNYIAKQALSTVVFKEVSRVEFVIDRSKNKKEIDDFNNYIINQLKSSMNDTTLINIYHHSSHENYGLQAVDLFSWGIYRRYQLDDMQWYDIFKKKIKLDKKIIW